ncbi:MAG: glycosyltransferase family 4 protein [Planctomycetota bacterium]
MTLSASAVAVPETSPTAAPVSLLTQNQSALLAEDASDQSLGATTTAQVLHVVNGEHFSGAERVQAHLGHCLPTFGITADFACVKPGRFADRLDQQSDQPQPHRWGRCWRTPMRHRFDRSVVTRVAAIVREHQYDLLHAHTPRTAMITAAVSRQCDVPWIYHVHSPAARDGSQWFRNRINAFVESRSLRSCAHQITVSKSLKSDLIARGFNQDDVTVVHNGVPAIFPKRDSQPVVGGLWTMGMIALMRPRKGLEIALRAIATLRQRGIDVTFRCIGPFETRAYRQAIDREIDRLNIGDLIQWVGFTDDVPTELAKLDAMVLPSLYGEGLPMVVLESMAAGTPVIATDVEGTPEAIRDGVEGWLAKPRDSDSLADAMESLIDGRFDWTAMSRAARDRHAEAFSDLAMAKATSRVYEHVLCRR